jgi:hypothetical protein
VEENLNLSKKSMQNYEMSFSKEKKKRGEDWFLDQMYLQPP